MNKATWMVRAGRGGTYAEDFVQNNYVGIGWRDGGDPTAVTDKSILVARFATAYPDAKVQSRFVGASIVFRFVREVQVGDGVVTYDPSSRTYHRGTIAGPAEWRGDPEDWRNTCRKVAWTGEVGRDQLSLRARNTLGATLTLFLLPADVASELLAPQGNGERVVTIAAEESDLDVVVEADPFADIADLAVERIKDRIAKLDWEEMQELVAALLRAMGYRTSVAARGPDRGRDILATPDGFGFRPPRIIVEVKHRVGQAMGAPEVRAMPVGRQADDRGLFVSTGGFTREAYYEAEHGKAPITLMTLDDLTRAIIDAYPQFDDTGRALLPLRRLYWPVD